MRTVLGRDKGAFGDVGTDGQEGCVKFSLKHGGGNVVDLDPQLHRHAHGDDALHLGLQHLARQTVLGDAKAHHAAHQGTGFLHRNAVTEAAQLIGRRHTAGAGTDHQYMFAGFGCRLRQLPAVLQRLIAQETLHRVDAHRRVNLAAVALAFAGVVADPAHDGRKGVVLHQVLPGLQVVAAFGMKQPALDVFAGRALHIAGRKPVYIDRALGAPGAGLVGQRGAGVERDGKRFFHGHSPVSSSNLKRRILRSASAWMCATISGWPGVPNKWAKRFCNLR